MNYMVRHGLSVAEALHIFAKHRPPGIYKTDYIDALFKYNHELPCGALAFGPCAFLASLLSARCPRAEQAHPFVPPQARESQSPRDA